MVSSHRKRQSEVAAAIAGAGSGAAAAAAAIAEAAAPATAAAAIRNGDTDESHTQPSARALAPLPGQHARIETQTQAPLETEVRQAQALAQEAQAQTRAKAARRKARHSTAPAAEATGAGAGIGAGASAGAGTLGMGPVGGVEAAPPKRAEALLFGRPAWSITRHPYADSTTSDGGSISNGVERSTAPLGVLGGVGVRPPGDPSAELAGEVVWCYSAALRCWAFSRMHLTPASFRVALPCCVVAPSHARTDPQTVYCPPVQKAAATRPCTRARLSRRHRRGHRRGHRRCRHRYRHRHSRRCQQRQRQRRKALSAHDDHRRSEQRLQASCCRHCARGGEVMTKTHMHGRKVVVKKREFIKYSIDVLLSCPRTTGVV